MPTVVLVLTTVPSDFSVHAFSRTLVSEGLAACVSALPPMDSTFMWKGKLDGARERQVFIKTTSERVEALQEAVSRLHPYDVPEFLVIPVSGGSASYLAWVAQASA